MALDRELLMRRYAPRLFQQAAGMVVDEPNEQDEPENETQDETEDDEVVDDGPHRGVMIGLFLSPPDAAALAIPQGEPADQLHLTLAYLGEADEHVTREQLPTLRDVVAQWASQLEVLTVDVTGPGRFDNADEVVQYAAIDAPQLAEQRRALATELAGAGFEVSRPDDFTAHVTLAYGESAITVTPRTLTFDAVTIAYAGEHTTLPLARPVELARAYTTPRIPDGALTIPTTTKTVTWNPVVTNIGARTYMTGPATVERAAMWGSPPNPNPHMLWMQGRFVGAEKPNRNNALWSVKDLEMGHPTVAYGPLNWLHEDKHVIGTIADAQLIPSRTGETAEVGDLVREAHIVALSTIWRWIYPDEASVVEMASESGVLAYSMECISESVECAGMDGCGASYPYLKYSQGDTCDHLKDKTSTRRLVNPTFLGGAVIVPPTRPGWAEANAMVMTRASAMAERAFDQAGHPDIPASTWEQMMAGVLTFAQGRQ